jgi:hypothetical protein
MEALLQRLKELDSKVFESFCFHLLKERYPGIEIHHVHGAGGDEGVDLFSGHLENQSVVWQCKAFSSGVGESQKAQIKESLRAALVSVKPARWVLCINVNFNTANHRWWLRLKDSYNERVNLELISASELAHQLIFRRTLREAFFPQVIMDVAQIRAAINRSTHLTKEDLAALATENVGQLTDRLNDLGPDFAYEVAFRSNTGPMLDATRAGALLTIQNDERITHVFARDPERMSRNPPRTRFTLQGEGATKFMEMMDTGRPFETEPGEIVTFSSDFDFLMPADVAPVSEWRLSVQQDRAALKEYLFRLTFGRDADAVTYDLVKFRTVSAGQKEVQLRSTTKLPFAISLKISLVGDGGGSMQFSEQLAGFNAEEIDRGASAILAMIKAGELDIHDLETGKRFFRLYSDATAPEWISELPHIVRSMLKVNAFYGTRLVWPSSISEGDLTVLKELDNLVEGVPAPLESFRLTLTKAVQLPPAVIRDSVKSRSFRFCHSPQDAVALFGTSVRPAPLQITVSNGFVRNRRQFESFLRNAPIGSSIVLQVSSPFGAIINAMPRSNSVAQ